MNVHRRVDKVVIDLSGAVWVAWCDWACRSLNAPPGKAATSRGGGNVVDGAVAGIACAGIHMEQEGMSKSPPKPLRTGRLGGKVRLL